VQQNRKQKNLGGIGRVREKNTGNKEKKDREEQAIKIEIKGEKEVEETPSGYSGKPERPAETKAPQDPTEKLQNELEEKTREANDHFDKWLRLRAEFENYKKRMQKEKADALKFGNENLLKAILPILDNLGRAIDHGKEVSEVGPLMEGVEMIRKELLNTLDRFGVKPIAAAGEIFNPEKHEAIAQEETEGEPNRIVAEAQTGYSYHDRLLRPAKVVVSREKAKG
jgi:molecular chaperone GrpE